MGRQKTVTPEQRKQYHAEWRAKNREKWNAYGAKWYALNRQKRSRKMRLWDVQHPEQRKEIEQRWYEKNKDTKSEKQRIRLLDYKTRIVEAYGGSCACCKEKEITFLTVEHTKKDGMDHRQVKGNFYAHLVRMNFPKDQGLLILCMNCNWAERNGKTCPHKKSASTSAVVEQK
jgi:hypothetical protein